LYETATEIDHYPNTKAITNTNINTNSNVVTNGDGTLIQFPKIKVRECKKTFNIDLMTVLVEGVATLNLCPGKVLKYTAMLANKVFGQNWEISEEDNTDANVDDRDGNVGNVNTEDCQPKRKKYKHWCDHTYILPCKQTLNNWIYDSYILNFHHLAENVMTANAQDKVVVLGLDDSIKADGNKKFDMKTGHVTVVDSEHKRTTYSTGFLENISHSGSNQAMSINHIFSLMATLCETTPEFVKSCIDFFMLDRSGDGESALNELEIEEEKRLNCNAHIVLVELASLNAVFCKIEDKIGAEKLISTNASHVFNTSGGRKSSIWLLGIIAFSKLLGPKHCKECISLYVDYKSFVEGDAQDPNSDTKELSSSLLKLGFASFTANRFGRSGYISSCIVQHFPLLVKFFEGVVDESSNKLNLACTAYLQSEYFRSTCEIAKHSYENVVLPILRGLGIDFQNTHSEYR